MRINGKDIVLAGLAVVIVAVILLFGFPIQGSGTNVTTTWTVDFAGTPAPIAPGDVTTWTFAGGAWTMTSVANGGHSVWIFTNTTSKVSCVKDNVPPSRITIDFGGMPAPMRPGNITTWSYNQNAWFRKIDLTMTFHLGADQYVLPVAMLQGRHSHGNNHHRFHGGLGTDPPRELDHLDKDGSGWTYVSVAKTATLFGYS